MVRFNIVVLLALTGCALADFDMYQVDQTNICGTNSYCDTYAYTIVSTSDANCNAAASGSEANEIPDGPLYGNEPFPEELTFNDGVCGSGTLNFYANNGNANSNGYTYFISGGDGTPLGDCSPVSETYSTCVVGDAADSAWHLFSCTGLC